MIQVKVTNVGPIVSADFTIRGVTLLTGESGSGKSSLVSAIQGAVINKFPTRLLRFGESFFTVSLVIDGEEITWVKKANTSPHITFKGETMSKTSQYTITELEDHINMSLIEVGNEKVPIHFIDQFIPPLIRNFSHKKLSDILSASSEVDKAHKLLRRVKEEGLKATGSFNTLSNLISESKLKIDRLNNLVQIGNESKSEVLAYQEKLRYFEEELTALEKLVADVQRFTTLRERYHQVHTLIIDIETYLACKQRLYTLSLLEQYNSSSTRIEERIQEINELISHFNAYVQVKERALLLGHARDQINRGVILSKRISDIKKFTEDKICPICGTSIDG